jgi:hypothetical protein
MKDVRVTELAARQYNRFSRAQLRVLGVSDEGIKHRVETGRWVAVHEGVYAIAPPLDEDRARWMAATLTDEGSVLSHASAAAAWGWWDRRRDVEIVTRPGAGGPRRHGELLVFRSETLAADTTMLMRIPITCVVRTLLDLAAHVDGRLLARCVREAIRLGTTSASEIVDALLGRHRGRRGSRRLILVVRRYSGLPVDRARSGAEIRALEILRDAGREMPVLNRKVAGEEADLTWRRHRLIIEIDGGPFHLDRGEDARKQAVWQHAGFAVLRLPSEDVYADPQRLLAMAPNVPE